jgi:molybdopterin synthase catalytic subunit
LQRARISQQSYPEAFFKLKLEKWRLRSKAFIMAPNAESIGLDVDLNREPGCTRDTFVPEAVSAETPSATVTTPSELARPSPRPVTHLVYAAYPPLALRTLLTIAQEISRSYAPDLIGLAIVHRLGRVEIGEESILVAVATPHRGAAWRAAEECLEKIKRRAEIWKEEWVVGAGNNDDGLTTEDGKGIWRANDKVIVVGSGEVVGDVKGKEGPK